MKLRQTSLVQIDPKDFVFVTGVVFSGLSITESPGGYNVVVRGYSRDGRAVYAMTVCEELWDGPNEFLRHLETPAGDASWRKDRFRSDIR